jgi:hypothetical protein
VSLTPREVAIHESAHAVVALALKVSVVAAHSGRTGGAVWHSAAPTEEDRATIGLAGALAVMKYRPGAPFFASEADLAGVSEDPEFLGRCGRRAEQILTDRWGAVCYLAGILEEHGILQAEAVLKIIGDVVTPIRKKLVYLLEH